MVRAVAFMAINMLAILKCRRVLKQMLLIVLWLTIMTDLKDYLKEGPTPEEVTFMKNAIGQRDARNYETGMQKAAVYCVVF